MHIGAQPVPPSLIKHWMEYFPHHKYDTNYGLSESTGPGCVHLGMDHIHKVGAIGVPGYGWKVKIVDEQGQAVPQGEVGELCVKGPGVMPVSYTHLDVYKRQGCAHPPRRRWSCAAAPESWRQSAWDRRRYRFPARPG